MSSEKALVNTINKNFKEGNTDMRTKPNVAKEAITPPIEKKKIYTVKKIEKSQASNKKVDTYSRNKPDKGK